MNVTLATHLRGHDAEAKLRWNAESKFRPSSTVTSWKPSRQAIIADDVLKLDLAEHDEIEAAFKRVRTRDMEKLGPTYVRLSMGGVDTDYGSYPQIPVG